MIDTMIQMHGGSVEGEGDFYRTPGLPLMVYACSIRDSDAL